MLIKGTTIINKQIRSSQDGSYIGRVADLIIDPDTGKLLALKMQSSGFFKPKIVCTIDIQGFTPFFLVAKDDSVVIKAEEVLKVDDVLKKKILIIGNKVKTESGKLLGICEDVLVDTSTSAVIKFYVKTNNLLGPLPLDTIIPSSRVIRITRDAIVVKENDVKEKVTAVAEIAEPAE